MWNIFVEFLKKVLGRSIWNDNTCREYSEISVIC